MAREHLQTPVSLDEIGLQRWPACISSVARIERAIFVSMEDAARRWRLFENPTFATLEWPSLRFSTHYGKHLEDEHLKSTAAGGRARSIRANSDFCSRWGLPSGAVPPPRIMRHRLRRICRSPSLPPEERELPDVLAGRHHQRAQCEHAGLAYGALELRELSEPVVRLGVERQLLEPGFAQQQYDARRTDNRPWNLRSADDVHRPSRSGRWLRAAIGGLALPGGLRLRSPRGAIVRIGKVYGRHPHSAGSRADCRCAEHHTAAARNRARGAAARRRDARQAR